MTTYLAFGSRTPQGAFLGELSTVPATKLGSIAIKGALEKSGLKANQIDEVFMGHVLQSGCGQAPARQASLGADLLESTPCTTINKVCGSGMMAVILGHQKIALGEADAIVAGGMENMSMAPGLMPSFRTGIKFGSGEIKDHMAYDGLWDVYSNRAMGNCAEECTKKYNLTREEQDNFAIESFKRAQKATSEGVFAKEISPVEIQTRKGTITVSVDEGPQKVMFEKIPTLRPAFEKDGTITAANASTINDGAAAVVLMSEKYKDHAEFKIVATASHAQNPTWFTTAPVEATKKCLEKANLNISQIDYFEVNEAFAAVTMASIKDLELDPNKTNIYGGAISLGHPIGVSGTRIIISLMSALKNNNKKFGLASICIGGGEALAVIIERL